MQHECAMKSDPNDRAHLEPVIARIWASLLDVPTVEPDDNFLLLGGESLLAVQAAGAIKEELGCEISIRSIFTLTVSEVAAEVEAHSVTG
jgi:acyl carrier protein